MNLKNRDSDLENELICLPGEREFREFGKVMYILLYSKWITNKDLLYNTWNSTQCYVPAQIGGGFEGEWIRVYVQLSPFAIQSEITTTLLINYIPIQNKKFIKLKKKKPTPAQGKTKQKHTRTHIKNKTRNY